MRAGHQTPDSQATAAAAAAPTHLQRWQAMFLLQMVQLAMPNAVLPRARAPHVLQRGLSGPRVVTLSTDAASSHGELRAPSSSAQQKQQGRRLRWAHRSTHPASASTCQLKAPQTHKLAHGQTSTIGQSPAPSAPSRQPPGERVPAPPHSWGPGSAACGSCNKCEAHGCVRG